MKSVISEGDAHILLVTQASTAILEVVRTDYRDRISRQSNVEATPPMLRHTPFFACSQMVAAYGHVVHLAASRRTATSAPVDQQDEESWQRRVTLSDLTLSEANAAECAHVWPIVIPYVQQVRQQSQDLLCSC